MACNVTVFDWQPGCFSGATCWSELASLKAIRPGECLSFDIAPSASPIVPSCQPSPSFSFPVTLFGNETVRGGKGGVLFFSLKIHTMFDSLSFVPLPRPFTLSSLTDQCCSAVPSLCLLLLSFRRYSQSHLGSRMAPRRFGA